MSRGAINIDKVLTNVSEAYTNDTQNFIAEKFLPVIPVERKSGKYWSYNKDNLRVPATDLRTGRSKTREADYGKTLKDWGPLQEHALKGFITKDEYELTDSPLNPETDLVNFLNEQMLISEEKSAADILTDTSVITHNSSPTNKWDTDAGDPFKDLTAAVKVQRTAAMRGPNSMGFGFDVWLALINSKAIIERVKYSERGVVTMEMVKALFAPYGITNIFVGDVTVNTGKEGLADSLSTVWSDNVILGYVTPSPSLRTLNGGYTMRLNNGKYVDRWDEKDEKGTFIRNNDYYDQFIFNTDLFYQLTDVLT